MANPASTSVVHSLAGGGVGAERKTVVEFSAGSPRELFPLLAAGDADGAALLLSGPLSAEAEQRAARTLATHAVRGPDELGWIESLLAPALPLGPARRLALACRIGVAVDSALRRGGHTRERQVLLGATVAALEREVALIGPAVSVLAMVAPVFLRHVRVLQSRKDAAALRRALARAREIGEAWFQAAPADGAAWAHFAQVHIVAGDIAWRGENAAELALTAYRRAVTIAGRGGDAAPAGARHVRILTRACGRLGDVLREQGDLAGALTSYRRSLALAESGAVASPHDPKWQGELARCHQRMGEVMGDQHDHEGALLAHRQSLQLFERLHLQDAEDIRWRQEIAASQTKIGDALMAHGRVAAALSAYRYATGIRQRIATAVSEADDIQHELWIIYGKLAAAHEKAGNDEAAHWWRQAHDVLARLKEHGNFRSGLDEQFLTWLRLKAFADASTVPSGAPGIFSPR